MIRFYCGISVWIKLLKHIFYNLDIDNTMAVFKIEISDVKHFKVLLGTLKDILVDLNVKIERTIGMTIIGFDRSNKILVKVVIPLGDFALMECNVNRILFCISAQLLFKIVNTATPNSNVTFFVLGSDYRGGIASHLHVRVDSCITQLKLLELDPVEMEIPSVTYATTLTTDSKNFQAHIKNLSSIGEILTFRTSNNSLEMYARSEFATSCVIVPVEIHRIETTSGCYESKLFKSICKVSVLAKNVVVQLHENLPLVLTYTFGASTISFCVSQMTA